jgi:hypothetical protein
LEGCAWCLCSVRLLPLLLCVSPFAMALPLLATLLICLLQLGLLLAFRLML